MTTVSLVLGSGGARGLAHIGVIRWLLANGYSVRSISGSSIGALIGGIYAAGQLDVYEQWVVGLERRHVIRLLDPTIGRSGLFKGERIIEVLRQLIGDRAIEDLPIGFTAVATDLDSGAEVWLRQGQLFDAIRASIATPLVFTPFAQAGRLLLDGAVVNPVPIAPTLEDDTDLTVVVDLSGKGGPHRSVQGEAAAVHDASGRGRLQRFFESVRPGTRGKPRAPSFMDVAFGSMQAMQDTIARLRLEAYSPDIQISIPRDACGFFEFWQARKMIDLGRECTALAFARASAAPSGMQHRSS